MRLQACRSWWWEDCARPTRTSSWIRRAQEIQVAELAREVLSNTEIGTRLFISPKTVEYHLSKVFTKLGIGSRIQLARVLPGEPGTARRL
jgi:DNA-binding CsgD family transcriptional regulator